MSSSQQLAFDLASAAKTGRPFSPMPPVVKRSRSPYERFLAERAKRSEVADLGRHVGDEEMHPSLFPFQREAVRWAARKGRAGLFADCGLGKSRMQLTWASTVADRSLIVAPLSVARQTVREAAAIDMDLRYVRSGEDAAGPGVQGARRRAAARPPPRAQPLARRQRFSDRGSEPQIP